MGDIEKVAMSGRRRQTIKSIILAGIVIAMVAGLSLAPLPLQDRTRVANSTVIARAPDAVFTYGIRHHWP